MRTASERRPNNPPEIFALSRDDSGFTERHWALPSPNHSFVDADIQTTLTFSSRGSRNAHNGPAVRQKPSPRRRPTQLIAPTNSSATALPSMMSSNIQPTNPSLPVSVQRSPFLASGSVNTRATGQSSTKTLSTKERKVLLEESETHRDTILGRKGAADPATQPAQSALLEMPKIHTTEPASSAKSPPITSSPTHTESQDLTLDDGHSNISPLPPHPRTPQDTVPNPSSISECKLINDNIRVMQPPTHNATPKRSLRPRGPAHDNITIVPPSPWNTAPRTFSSARQDYI